MSYSVIPENTIIGGKELLKTHELLRLPERYFGKVLNAPLEIKLGLVHFYLIADYFEQMVTKIETAKLILTVTDCTFVGSNSFRTPYKVDIQKNWLYALKELP